MKAEIVIEDSLALRLKEVADASHISFTQAIEKAISAGLPHLRSMPLASEARRKQLDAANASLRQADEEIQIEHYRRSGG